MAGHPGKELSRLAADQNRRQPSPGLPTRQYPPLAATCCLDGGTLAQELGKPFHDKLPLTLRLGLEFAFLRPYWATKRELTMAKLQESVGGQKGQLKPEPRS